MHLRLLLSLAVVTGASLGATRASAFCRTTTNQTFQPSFGKPCDDVGKPISWPSKCTGYSLQKAGSVQIDLASATAIVEQGFAEWMAHDCGACGAPGKPAMTAQNLGPVECGNVEYNADAGNANVIVFRDATWPHDPSALALTTVTFRLDTGEIYDADMEIQSNPASVKLAVSDPVQPGTYDLRSIVTHEAGHFFGLAHTQPMHSDATMYASYQPGETHKRNLTPDDVCGICTIYPPTRAAICDPTPRGGLAGTCGGVKKSGCGCAGPGASNREGVALGALTVALSMLLARRRRR